MVNIVSEGYKKGKAASLLVTAKLDCLNDMEFFSLDVADSRNSYWNESSTGAGYVCVCDPEHS